MGQILLVRHGQASWDGDDYDVLSERGHVQAEVLGQAFAERGLRPDRIVTGGMRRHRETCEGIVAGAGLEEVSVQVDPGWDEYDHVSMLAQVPTSFAGERPTAAEFQSWIERATDRWIQGENAGDYHEPFDAFADRVEAAQRRAEELEGTTVVVTSGGPISWVAASLIGGGPAQWARLNVVCVNTGVTKLVTGRRGTTLVTFNEHTHLDTRTDLLTYR